MRNWLGSCQVKEQSKRGTFQSHMTMKGLSRGMGIAALPQGVCGVGEPNMLQQRACQHSFMCELSCVPPPRTEMTRNNTHIAMRVYASRNADEKNANWSVWSDLPNIHNFLPCQLQGRHHVERTDGPIRQHF